MVEGIQEFEAISMKIGLTVLIGYMIFIVYDLAKKSKAGKYGYIALFGGLCLGLFGFIAKGVITHMLDIQ